VQGHKREDPTFAVKPCLIVPSLEVRYGGPSKSVLGLATEMARTIGPVELLTTEPGRGWQRTEGRLEVHAFRRDWPGSVCPSSGLRRHLQSTDANVIHHHSIWLRTLHYAHQTAHRLGAPLIVSPRGMMDSWAWRHHHRKKAFARAVIHPGAFEAVDGWHATSEDEAGAIRELGFRQPICVAPNGVAVPSAEELQGAAAHWKELIPACAQRPVALFYSRFHRKKRLLELIDSWLENVSGDWLLLVVGIPEDYTAAMLEDYVLRAGHAGRVRAFDGSGHPPPYAVASLFVLPSHGENFGLSIAEALASGVPALVTTTTPWMGMNEHGCGWCVPWQQYGSTLKAATSEGSASLRARGAIGREWVRAEFSWERPARLLADFYSTLRAGTNVHRP
jgi:glycosyltransferase involved in cell wall biosynthesis